MRNQNREALRERLELLRAVMRERENMSWWRTDKPEKPTRCHGGAIYIHSMGKRER